MRFSVFIVGALAFIGGARIARGDPAQEPLRLEYRAPPGCDDAAQFMTALRARTPKVRPATAGEVARSFNVEISAGTTSTRVRLTIREPNGAKTVRELSAKDCREAVDAIVLVAALAVDPQASSAPVPSGRAESNANADRNGTSATEKGATEKGATEKGALENGAAPKKAPERNKIEKGDAERDAAPVEGARSTTHAADDAMRGASPLGWSLGLAAAARTGLAPAWLFGGRLGLEIEARASGWNPSLRVWGEYAPRTTFAVQEGRVAFSYAGGTVELCPLGVHLGAPLLLRPCLLVDLGVVAASGLDVPNARSASRFRLALGPEARFAWALGPRIALELDLGCTFPTRRDRYRFDPLLIYQPPAVGLTGAVGVNLLFP